MALNNRLLHIKEKLNICRCGGIGIHTCFRYKAKAMQVRILSSTLTLCWCDGIGIHGRLKIYRLRGLWVRVPPPALYAALMEWNTYYTKDVGFAGSNPAGGT